MAVMTGVDVEALKDAAKKAGQDWCAPLEQVVENQHVTRFYSALTPPTVLALIAALQDAQQENALVHENWANADDRNATLEAERDSWRRVLERMTAERDGLQRQVDAGRHEFTAAERRRDGVWHPVGTVGTRQHAESELADWARDVDRDSLTILSRFVGEWDFAAAAAPTEGQETPE